MSFLDDIRKDHPALQTKHKEMKTKDFAAMYNVLCKVQYHVVNVRG